METINLKKKNLSEEVLEHVINWIIEGKFKPGDKLPSEKELAEIFGVSRLTVREALKQLELMSLVDIQQGDGTYVKYVKPESYMKSLLPLIVLDTNSIKDFIDVRLCVEKSIVQLFVKNANSEKIRRLNEIVDRMKVFVEYGNLADYHKEDVKFHLFLAQACGNKIFYYILNIIQDVLYKQIKEILITEEACKISVDKHIKLADAIKNKDVTKAQKIIEEHLIDAQKLLLKRISQIHKV